MSKNNNDVITSIAFNLDKMTKQELNELKSAIQREIEEVKKTINNYHIWALGSTTQEEAIKNENLSDMEREYLKLLQSILDSICKYEETITFLSNS